MNKKTNNNKEKKLSHEWIGSCNSCKRKVIKKRMENRRNSPIVCSDCGTISFKEVTL